MLSIKIKLFSGWLPSVMKITHERVRLVALSFQNKSWGGGAKHSPACQRIIHKIIILHASHTISYNFLNQFDIANSVTCVILSFLQAFAQNSRKLKNLTYMSTFFKIFDNLLLFILTCCMSQHKLYLSNRIDVFRFLRLTDVYSLWKQTYASWTCEIWKVEILPERPPRFKKCRRVLRTIAGRPATVLDLESDP